MADATTPGGIVIDDPGLRAIADQLQKQHDAAAETLATEVVALPTKQAGQDILVARCPFCRTVAGLSGEGKHFCRTCHRLLSYKAGA